MKQRGALRAIAGALAALAAYTKDLFSTVAHSEGGHIAGDRQGFASVSVPRCHTQRKRYTGHGR
jgi:hypothetical protein